MKILQPAGWPRPKGYANGISAKGRVIFTAGIIGCNEHEIVTSHRFEEQFGFTSERLPEIFRKPFRLDAVC